MRGSHYTQEQNTFICEYYSQVNNIEELAGLYNKRYHANMTAESMGKKCRALGLKWAKQRDTMLTDEVIAFLLEHWESYTSAELAEQLNKRFGIQPKVQTVTWWLHDKLGVHRGNCFTPKGYQSRACKPIGTERVDKGRILMVKVDHPNVWKPKAQVVKDYDPRKFQPIFVDGNPLNCDPDNILVVSKKIHARLAKNGWLNSSEDILKAGIKWSELLYALQELGVNA